MAYTLSNLRNLLLQHLGRNPGDESLDTAMLDSAINRNRRRVWTVAGGPVSDTLRQDLVAGRRDTIVSAPGGTAGILGVSVRDGTGDHHRPRPLVRMTVYDLRHDHPGYPGDPGALGVPSAYVVRPAASVSPGWTSDPDGLGMPQQTGVAVSLFPVPNLTVPGGLLIEAAGAAGPLMEAAHVSPLPEMADEAACWAAADELFAYRATEPGAALTLEHIQRHAAMDIAALKDLLSDLDGGLPELLPAENFGPGGTGRPAIVWGPDYRTL